VIEDKLTVIIPTHERSNYLRRALEYWENCPYHLMIVDSSKLAFQNIPKKCEYLHLPGKTFVEKITLALQQLKTPFVAMCPDDDFHSFASLKDCALFLQQNAEYASVHGHYISFLQQANGLQFSITYNNIHGYELISDDPEQRIADAMHRYVIQLWAVHRKEYLLKALDACQGISNDRAVELTIALVPMMYGKHKVLPMFYSARERLPDSWGVTEPPLLQWLSSPEKSNEVHNWKVNLAKLLSDSTGKAFETCFQTIDQAIGGYVKVLSDSHHRSQRILQIRKYIPEYILQIRRKLLKRDAAVNENIEGYPWSDPKANEVWQRMEAVILKHGCLYETEK